MAIYIKCFFALFVLWIMQARLDHSLKVEKDEKEIPIS